MPSSVTTPKRKLCVYCGSAVGVDPAFAAAARTLGAALGEHGIGLVYGGGKLGLMGETAEAALKAGGHVTGIIPEFLVRRERMLDNVHDLIVTANMHERKMTMFEHADGFVALPGGIGTLEELIEVSTWAQLGQHNKPVMLANINGYWDHLLELTVRMRAHGFLRPGLELHFSVVDTADDIVPTFLRLLKKRRALPGTKSIRTKA